MGMGSSMGIKVGAAVKAAEGRRGRVWGGKSPFNFIGSSTGLAVGKPMTTVGGKAARVFNIGSSTGLTVGQLRSGGKSVALSEEVMVAGATAFMLEIELPVLKVTRRVTHVIETITIIRETSLFPAKNDGAAATGRSRSAMLYPSSGELPDMASYLLASIMLIVALIDQNALAWRLCCGDQTPNVTRRRRSERIHISCNYSVYWLLGLCNQWSFSLKF